MTLDRGEEKEEAPRELAVEPENLIAVNAVIEKRSFLYAGRWRNGTGGARGRASGSC